MSDWVIQQAGLALGSRFRRLSDQLSGEVRIVYKKLKIDFNPTHFPVLSLLYEHIHTGMSISEIATELNISHVSVSQTIKELEKQGYCTRIPHKSDDRILLIFLTKKSEILLKNQLLTIWKIIKRVTELRVAEIQGDFWQVIAQAEEKLSRYSLSQEILEEIKNCKSLVYNPSRH
ncbi:MarR family winged helix-turn-helix transcriptional regulator [Endozoicomonas acroporae]|uniref:MarR family winged helix-turn-helix transcriptional regulator n=1 Tax=Endozoicomonas acroporae TaxID=1701104 RepID=UPI003D797EDA